MAVQPLKMSSILSSPIIKHTDRGDLRVCDLPLRLMNEHGTFLVQVCDVVLGQPAFNWEEITELCQIGQYKRLPAPLCLKEEPSIPYTMQLIIHKEDDDTHTVLKHLIFAPNKMHVTAIKRFCYGQAMQISYGKNFQTGSVAVQYMMERLGGFQVRYYTLTPKAVAKTHPDRDVRKKGYTFIRERGPKANNLNQFVEWTDEWINAEGSPIHGWSAGEVKESLSNYAKGKSGAKTIANFPVTLKKMYPAVLDNMMIPMLETHHKHGILWVGKSRVGKSTASKAAGFALSAFHIGKHERTDLEPSVVTAKRMDFFRLEPGTVFKPAIADDIPLHKLDTDEVKAFHDVGEEDALLWARWGGASFDMGQSRQSCVNPYHKAGEPTKSCSVFREEITLAEFINMVDVNFPKGSDAEDVMAYINRMHIVLLTDNWIYWRLADAGDANVPRMEWPTPDPKKRDLFVPEVREILKAYKKDNKYRPAQYESDFAWDVELVRMLSRGERPPRTTTITRVPVGSSEPVTEYNHPQLPLPLDATEPRVELEQSPVDNIRASQASMAEAPCTRVFKALKTGHGGSAGAPAISIDISDSPVSQKTRADEDFDRDLFVTIKQEYELFEAANSGAASSSNPMAAAVTAMGCDDEEDALGYGVGFTPPDPEDLL